MLPRPKLFIVFVAWAAACGLLFVVWQDPPALPAQQQHLSPPAAPRARKERTRAHVSNPLYLRIRGSDATEKYPTYRRDGINAVPSSSPLPPRRHQNHRNPAKTRGPRPISRPQALRAWRNRHRHTQARGESEARLDKNRGHDNYSESDLNGTSDGEEQYYGDVYNGEEAPVREYADGNEADGDQAEEPDQEEETEVEGDDEGQADDGYISNAEEKKEMLVDEGEGEEEDEEGEVEVLQMEDGDFGGRYNATPESSLLVYNRIPKCASSTMQTILRRLSRHLGFEHISSLVYNQHQLNHGQQVELVENLTGALEAAPTHAISYDRHLYYTNFSALGAASPVYVNIVRDPVERFISSFYYRRSQERLSRIQQHGQSATPSPKWINRTVEQCVLAGDSECAFQPGDEKEMIITYFCGHHDFCRIVGHKDALQVAKQVVSQDYSVVGLVEHMEISLLLMETLLPRFMIGASQVYSSIKQKEQMMVNKNDEKPEVPEAIREKLLQRMADDFDFYNFLEQRLYQQRKTFLPDQGNV